MICRLNKVTGNLKMLKVFLKNFHILKKKYYFNSLTLFNGGLNSQPTQENLSYSKTFTISNHTKKIQTVIRSVKFKVIFKLVNCNWIGRREGRMKNNLSFDLLIDIGWIFLLRKPLKHITVSLLIFLYFFTYNCKCQ